MRILANENIPGDAITALRAHGHDVAWVRADAPGSSDEANLARAASEQRLLITLDKDFGELVFHRGLAASCGVVLFRISAATSSAVAERIAGTLDSRTDWANHFSVVDDRRIRILPLQAHTSRKPR
jgi:predicted nuclease of predicted toxin-antitoxin system